MMINAVYVHNKVMAVEKFEEQLIIIDLDMNVHCLNETARKIWEMIELEKNFEDIVKSFMDVYNLDRTTAEIDVSQLVDAMLAKGLISAKK